MIDALSDRDHSAFPLMFFLVVHGPNYIDILTFGKVVETSDKSYPVYIVSVHLGLCLNCMMHALLHDP